MTVEIDAKLGGGSRLRSFVSIYRLASMRHLPPELHDVGQHGNRARREAERGKSIRREGMHGGNGIGCNCFLSLW
jgi:hypothetical protein